jgi:hypothetical protein
VSGLQKELVSESQEVPRMPRWEKLLSLKRPGVLPS